MFSVRPDTRMLLRDSLLLLDRCLARRFTRTAVVQIATGNAERYEPARGIRNTLANDGRRLTKWCGQARWVSARRGRSQLGGTRLGETRLGETRQAHHPAASMRLPANANADRGTSGPGMSAPGRASFGTTWQGKFLSRKGESN